MEKQSGVPKHERIHSPEERGGVVGQVAKQKEKPLSIKMDCIKTVIEFPSPDPIKDANILPNKCEKWSPKAGIRNRYSLMFICDEKYCFLLCAAKPHLDKILFY
jgi:hypothetical protein